MSYGIATEEVERKVCGICAPIGEAGFSGKYLAICDLLEVSRIFHMGYAIGNSGLGSRPRPGVRPLFYYTTPDPSLSIGNFNKK